jgi:hypothetical protein
MKIILLFFSSFIHILLFACNENEVKPVNTSEITIDSLKPNPSGSGININNKKMKITIASSVFTATFIDNATATAFKAKLPLSITMKDLNRNEKFFDFDFNLTTNASNPGIIQSGDLMMYGANTLVLFYKTFSTSYSYTKVGSIDNPSGLETALGSGSVTVKFEME